MDTEEKQDVLTALVIIIIVFLGLGSCLVGCHEVEETNRAAIKAGLEQGSGPQGAMWVKPKPEDK